MSWSPPRLVRRSCRTFEKCAAPGTSARPPDLPMVNVPAVLFEQAMHHTGDLRSKGQPLARVASRRRTASTISSLSWCARPASSVARRTKLGQLGPGRLRESEPAARHTQLQNVSVVAATPP